MPLERADPSLGEIPVTFAVRAATDRSRPPLGTIFAVEGGPGYGSIASARYYIHMLGPLLERRDLVTVDMRGTGHSRAIDCPKLQQGRGSDAAGVAQCARILGPAFASYRTSAAADDLDAVREALGLDSIALYGDSYGTFLGQSYAYRHGENLDALVLDSAYPVRGESGWFPSLTPHRDPLARDRLSPLEPLRRLGASAARACRRAPAPARRAAPGPCSSRSARRATSRRAATTPTSTRRSAATWTVTAARCAG